MPTMLTTTWERMFLQISVTGIAWKSTLTAAWSCAQPVWGRPGEGARLGLRRSRGVGLRKDLNTKHGECNISVHPVYGQRRLERTLWIRRSWRFSVFLALARECDITAPVVPCGTVEWAGWPVLPHVCTGRCACSVHVCPWRLTVETELLLPPPSWMWFPCVSSQCQLPTVPALSCHSVFVWNPFPMCKCNQRRLLSVFCPRFQNDFQPQWRSSESSYE